MFRHPHYLDVPWDVHWHRETTGPRRHLWWLIIALTLLAIFLIGVGGWVLVEDVHMFPTDSPQGGHEAHH